MKYICPVCNKTFEASYLRQKRSKLVHCSSKCYWQSLKGRKLPSEHCENIRKAIIGKGNPFYGKKHTIETKFKISQSRKGKYCGKIHHMTKNPRRGKNALNWKGGIVINAQGYICVYSPNHPFKDKRKYVRQSRLVAEICLERYLEPTEITHHIDFNKANNHPNNIFVFENNSAHAIYHLCLRYNPSLKNLPLESNLI